LSELAGAITRKLRPASDSFLIKHTVEATFRDCYGNVTSHSITKNLRTNLGADYRYVERSKRECRGGARWRGRRVRRWIKRQLQFSSRGVVQRARWRRVYADHRCHGARHGSGWPLGTPGER